MVKKNFYELTNPQKNIWNTELFYPDTTINNICVSSIIDENLDFNLLKKSINKLVELNESFRINLSIIDTIPKQFISDFTPFNIDIIELNSKKEFFELEDITAKEKFTILNSNLYKFKIVKFPNGTGGIILNIHHIIADSWSLGITVKEILKIYHCMKSGNEYVSDTFPYSNLINSETSYKSSNRYETDKKFWSEYLENLPEPVTIPSINKNLIQNTSAAKRSSFIIDKKLVKNISDFCAFNKISVYTFFMSVYSLYIANIADVNDLILGTPILNRLNYKDKLTTGMFVTTKPFRCLVNGDDTFLNFILKNSINLTSILKHQKYSYSDIIEDIRHNDNNIPNLYNIAISYQITKAVCDDIGNYETNWYFNNYCLNDLNIHLYDANNTGNITVNYDYLSQKYTKEEIECHHLRILHVIDQILQNPFGLLKNIEIVTPDDKAQILNVFNNRTLNCPFNSNIIELFEKNVQQNPNNLALIYKNEKFTYKDLNNIVNKLAHFLMLQNIQENDIVGVYMNKNEWFIISILAIQKLGAAYLPMNPEYPEDRVNYILSDSVAKLLLTDQLINSSCTSINPSTLNLDTFDESNPEIKFDCNTLCYVIYTSGSTGKPKGVLLSHSNLINFLYNLNNCFENKFSPNDNCLSVANISFDASVQEIYAPLCFGATLVIYPENTLTDIPLLCDILEKNNITFSFMPPNILDDVFDFVYKNNRYFNINKLSVGVESIKNSTLNNFYKLNKNIEIVNGYGPSEATICSTFFVYHFDKTNSNVPIGYPLKNNNIYILNRFNNLQPVGIPGELCITGKSVSSGYLNNIELTNKSFINMPNLSDSKIYKTGDICYWLNDGCLEFVGRKDSQIKFRGHRIELSEIDNCIKNIDGISKSLTLLKNTNNVLSLCSYIVANNNITTEYINNTLMNILPYYMIPNHIVLLDKFPLTSNGKIDKAKLPEISYNINNIVKPSTSIEKNLHTMICELLNLKEISITDNFLNFGLDSLLAIRLSLKIYNEYNKNINIAEIFKYNTILNLAKYIEKTENESDDFEIKKYENNISYELSSAQKRIYYASKLAGSSSLLYNVSGGIVIEKKLDYEKVQLAFNKIINSNSIFRTYFKIENNEPRQFIAEHQDINIKVFNDNNLSKKEILSLVDSFPKAFDLEFAPLLRVELHYIENCSLILIDSHHIIMDGTSLNILTHEFCDLYNNIDINIENEVDYKDFTIWENNFINSNKIIQNRNYWLKRYSDYEIPVINLPYDFPKSELKTFKGEKLYYTFEPKLMKKINLLSNKFNVSNYMIFLTALYLLLYKYTGQENLIIGSPIEARNSIKLNNIIGNFVNNIALNQEINTSSSLQDLLLEVKDSVLSALTCQPYPYDMLIKDLKIPSNVSLFDVEFAYQNEVDYSNLKIDDKRLKVISSKTQTSKFNLTFEVVPSTSNINIEYNSNLFKPETINSLFEHYLFLLNNFANNLLLPIKDINIITKQEKNLLKLFNKTNDIINNDTVVSLFEKQVNLHPNNIALICDNKQLTYDELNKKANSLAHILINNGIKQNDIICIMTNRSLETIICMLGVLKAGAAFLNVDPTYPIERTQYYLEDCKAQYVLTQHCLRETVKSIKNCIEIDLDQDFYNYNFNNPCIKVAHNDLSYIIYTSGSTGKPKGVMLNQVGFANMAKAMTKVLDYLKEGNKHCLVSVTSTPFDIFVYEIIVSLTHGLKVLMANNAEHRNPILLDALIKKYNADVMTVTPSLMKINYDNRLEPSALSNIKYMVFGGEPLPEKFVQDLRLLSKNVTIYNIYGPSEITILSNVQNLNHEDKITIGPPIMNTQIHILDKYMQPVPIGVVGEIYISGIQVGLGYLGKPEMTKERFLPNKFGKGKMYKSGDIGRWTFDGKVQCLGRVDHQIKLRGLRIELGEIEEKIDSIKGVISSVVHKFSDNEKEYLCAYYVTDNNCVVTESEVKEVLRKTLPYYMVPTHVMHLDKMPYTINRKIDRKALPIPNLKSRQAKDIISNEKLSDKEKCLLNIWKKILNIETISITDNFFDIGGDSISAINMQLEAMKNGFNFEYADIFNYPNIKALANNNFKNSLSGSIDNYDYTDINKLLKNNNINNIKNIKKYNVNNILLIGGTGYLGAHIINSFLTNETGNIYCLVRQKNNVIPIERLKNTLTFYFGDNFYQKYENRICIIEGDITKVDLGLSKNNIDIISKNVSTIINSGAIVKHFGQKDLFEKINVYGSKHVVDFCKSLNKRLLHISTISVSGNGEKENSIQEEPDNINNKIIYNETNLFANQNLNGIYTTTKFKAERIILEAILHDNLDAQILRIGNIVNRYSDGVFQRNTSENAFAQRIKSFIKLGYFPNYSLEHAIELTPVDLCADAIIKILQYNSCCTVFHVYNPKLMSLKLFYDTLKDLKFNMKPVSTDEMTRIINKTLEDPTKKDILSGIIQDLDSNRKLIYTSNIKLDCEFTTKYLEKIGFKWKPIDKKYINKYINYFKKIKFLE